MRHFFSWFMLAWLVFLAAVNLLLPSAVARSHPATYYYGWPLPALGFQDGKYVGAGPGYNSVVFPLVIDVMTWIGITLLIWGLIRLRSRRMLAQ